MRSGKAGDPEYLRTVDAWIKRCALGCATRRDQRAADGAWQGVCARFAVRGIITILVQIGLDL